MVPNKQENCKIAATEKQNDTAFPLNQVALVVIWHHLALKAPRLLKFDVIKYANFNNLGFRSFGDVVFLRHLCQH